MNFDPLATPRPHPQPSPRPQPTPQPMPQRPAGEGVDPAARVATRTAAVARNREKAARASLIHDLLHIIGVIVLIGGVAWIVHVKHRHGMEEERLRAEREAAEQEARRQEREKAEKRAEANREKARKEAEEKNLKRERERQEQKQLAEEKRRIEDNKRRYEKVLARFDGTTLDQLSAAPREDFPENVTGETLYSCIMPVGSKGMTLYEMKALPNKEILVTCLDEEGTTTNIPYAEFSNLAKQNSFILAKGTYCYYKGRKNWEMRMPVPSANEKGDPSRDDFRDLYGFAARHCGKAPALAYEVFFIDAGLETRVHVVPFGRTFSRADVKKGLQQIVGAGTVRGRSVAVNDLEARLSKGSLVIRRKRGTR